MQETAIPFQLAFFSSAAISDTLNTSICVSSDRNFSHEQLSSDPSHLLLSFQRDDCASKTDDEQCEGVREDRVLPAQETTCRSEEEMVPDLIAVAEKAQDISAALDKFLVPVDDQSAEIMALMAECLSTSSALRELDRKIGDFPHHPRYPDISYDLTTVKESLNYTFKDVQRIFGGLGRVMVVPHAEYGYVWRDLCDYFRAESGNTLQRRLEIYYTVLQELSCTLTEG